MASSAREPPNWRVRLSPPLLMKRGQDASTTEQLDTVRDGAVGQPLSFDCGGGEEYHPQVWTSCRLDGGIEY